MNKGFTLAEVLLTLTIVGIVASITIPSIKANVDKVGYVAGVKKAYSVLQQAFTRAKTDNGGVIDTVFSSDSKFALNAFLNNMNVSQNCGTTANSTCIYDSPVKFLNSTATGTNFYSDTSFAKAILSDGMIIILLKTATDCNTTIGFCGYIFFDVNGFKPPNQWGRDVFEFQVRKIGIYPSGGNAYDTQLCDNEGYGCAGKIIQEGAMNY